MQALRMSIFKRTVETNDVFKRKGNQKFPLIGGKQSAEAIVDGFIFLKDFHNRLANQIISYHPFASAVQAAAQCLYVIGVITRPVQDVINTGL